MEFHCLPVCTSSMYVILIPGPSAQVYTFHPVFLVRFCTFIILAMESRNQLKRRQNHPRSVSNTRYGDWEWIWEKLRKAYSPPISAIAKNPIVQTYRHHHCGYYFIRHLPRLEMLCIYDLGRVIDSQSQNSVNI